LRARTVHLVAMLAAGVWGALAVGCAAGGVNEQLRSDMIDGRYATARAEAAAEISENREDRDYLLDRVRLLAAAMADGTDRMIEPEIAELYDLLRTQGLNADRTAASVVIGERNARIWKGEPFEQALAYAYIGLHDALDEDWGNARATARNALFLLRDFERSGGRLTDDPVEQRKAVIGSADPDEPIGYRPVASDFEFGYLLLALAAKEAGYPEEVGDALRGLDAIAPELNEVGERIRAGAYDLVVVASAGSAPRKVREGPDGAIGLFRPTSRSGRELLFVGSEGMSSSAPVATDINRMAEDLRWTSLEELRTARAAIGRLLVGGGVITLGVSDDNETAAAIGAGVAAVGALLLANAGADVRHAETLPQRLYLAPVTLPEGAETLRVEIDGGPGVTLPTAGLGPGGARVVYVRLNEGVSRWAPAEPRVLYANDATGDADLVGNDALPYVLGGYDVRTPTAFVMEDYWRAGLPRTIGVNELRELYRAEGIVFGEAAERDPTLRHVLEGGRGVYTPRAGSAGIQRNGRPRVAAGGTSARRASGARGAAWRQAVLSLRGRRLAGRRCERAAAARAAPPRPQRRLATPVQP